MRGIFREKRVGHGGTLDPMATGVLPVFVGQATRGVEFAESGQKEYVAGLRLGLVTDTQDTTGTILEIRPVTADRAAVEAVLSRFLGEQDQIPPMYSAIKVGGQKLYELARKGQEVARKPRHITIYELELLAQEGESDYLLRCRCSKGTYIRTLCHDIGQALGCGGGNLLYCGGARFFRRSGQTYRHGARGGARRLFQGDLYRRGRQAAGCRFSFRQRGGKDRGRAHRDGGCRGTAHSLRFLPGPAGCDGKESGGHRKCRSLALNKKRWQGRCGVYIQKN